MSAIKELSVNQLTCSLCSDIIDVEQSPPVSPTKRKWYSIFPGWAKEHLCSKIQEVACEHLFCQKCYKEFLTKTTVALRCPLCRKEVDDTLFVVDEKINEEVIIAAFLNDFNKNPSHESFEAALGRINQIKDKVKKYTSINDLVKICIKLKNCDFIMRFEDNISKPALRDVGLKFVAEGNVNEALNVAEKISTQNEEDMPYQIRELVDSIKTQAVQYLYDHPDKNNYSLKRAIELYYSIRSPEINFVYWPKHDAFKADVSRLKSQEVFKKKCFTIAYKSVIILTISVVAFFSLCYVRTIFKNRLSIF